MKKRRITGLITILMALPALGGLLLLNKIGSYPSSVKFVILNAVTLRGVIGTVGGILLFRGSKWGYYLSLITWLYLVTVSFLTFIQLYNSGLILSYDLFEQNLSNLSRPFLLALLKIVLGIPVIYLILGDLLNIRRSDAYRNTS